MLQCPVLKSSTIRNRSASLRIKEKYYRLNRTIILVVFLVGSFMVPGNISGQETTIYRTEKTVKDLFGIEKLIALNQLTRHYQSENSRKAVRYGRQAVALGENLLGTPGTPNDPKNRKQLLQAYFQLGEILYQRADYFEAQEQLQQAVALSEGLAGKPYLPQAKEYLENIQGMIDRGEIKENFFSKTFGDVDVSGIIDDASMDIKIQAEISAGKQNEKKGELATAMSHYETALQLAKDRANTKRINEMQLKIAALLDQLDQHEEAKELLNNAIAELESEIDTTSFRINLDSLSTIKFNERELVEETTATLREEQKNLKALSEQLARSRNFEQSLAYYKKYQELARKVVADSLLAAADAVQRENEIMLLTQQKEITDLKIQRLEEEKQKQIRLRNTYALITFLILGSSLITLFFYLAKRREHKRLTIAYRDLDNTKNKLIGAEQKIVKLLSQQVSGDVAKELLMGDTNKPGERRFVCIMFLDIRDFTPMAEKMSPEELIAYQNNVFGFMIDVVQKHNGNINQLLGDGFMATFGAPVSHGNDCQNGFNAAKEILQELKERNQAGVIKKTKVGIGLHAGYVVTGNVGTEARKQYSVTGNPVIIASRVEQLNKDYKSQLIITEEVYKHLEKPLELNQPFLEVVVKGRSNPVRILKMA